jgi:acyl carrier protein
MSADSVVARLTELFREVFDDDSIVLHRELTASDIEGWDSMAHLRLILAIHKDCGTQERGGRDRPNKLELAAIASVPGNCDE